MVGVSHWASREILTGILQPKFCAARCIRTVQILAVMFNLHVAKLETAPNDAGQAREGEVHVIDCLSE